MTFLIVWLPLSATKRFPLASMATPRGWLKRALLPIPSALPRSFSFPAKFVTAPSGAVLRIVFFPGSARNTLPQESTAASIREAMGAMLGSPRAEPVTAGAPEPAAAHSRFPIGSKSAAMEIRVMLDRIRLGIIVFIFFLCFWGLPA